MQFFSRVDLTIGFQTLCHMTVEKNSYIAEFVVDEEEGWLLKGGGL